MWWYHTHCIVYAKYDLIDEAIISLVLFHSLWYCKYSFRLLNHDYCNIIIIIIYDIAYIISSSMIKVMAYSNIVKQQLSPFWNSVGGHTTRAHLCQHNWWTNNIQLFVLALQALAFMYRRSSYDSLFASVWYHIIEPLISNIDKTQWNSNATRNSSLPKCMLKSMH